MTDQYRKVHCDNLVQVCNSLSIFFLFWNNSRFLFLHKLIFLFLLFVFLDGEMYECLYVTLNCINRQECTNIGMVLFPAICTDIKKFCLDYFHRFSAKLVALDQLQFFCSKAKFRTPSSLSKSNMTIQDTSCILQE